MDSLFCLHQNGFRLVFRDGTPEEYVECIACGKRLGPDDGYVVTRDGVGEKRDIYVSWVE